MPPGGQSTVPGPRGYWQVHRCGSQRRPVSSTIDCVNDIEWLQFRTRFPKLSGEGRSSELVRSMAMVRRTEPGEILYHDGDECGHLPMVLSGHLVLTKYGGSGRAITLYRVDAGNSCILSTLSILNNTAFPAEASSENAGSVVLLPATAVRQLVNSDPLWRDFVFSLYHERLSGLIELVEEVVFRRMDVRLAELLAAEAEASGGVVHKTHQEMAADLGSSREVVSRLLKDWERRGIVTLGRGLTEVHELSALRSIGGPGI